MNSQDANNSKDELKSLKSSSKKEGLFDWLIELYDITDDMIVKECGEEILFYLKYEKYTSVLFFLMFIPNSFLIWVYVKCSFEEGSAIESFI